MRFGNTNENAWCTQNIIALDSRALFTEIPQRSCCNIFVNKRWVNKAWKYQNLEYFPKQHNFLLLRNVIQHYIKCYNLFTNKTRIDKSWKFQFLRNSTLVFPKKRYYVIITKKNSKWYKCMLCFCILYHSFSRFTSYLILKWNNLKHDLW